MAEIRKHRPGQSAVAEAIEKAMGAAVKPVTPGAPSQPGRPSAAGVPQPPSFGAVPGAGSWVPITPDAVPVVPKHVEDDEDLEDE